MMMSSNLKNPFQSEYCPLGISGNLPNKRIVSWNELRTQGESLSPFIKLYENVYFSLFDSNPFSMEEATPIKKEISFNLAIIRKKNGVMYYNNQ